MGSLNATRKPQAWSPALLRRLRGKRTQTQFGRTVGVRKNTVWRWEKGLVAPDRKNSKTLARVARKERFLRNWKLVGSITRIADLEEGSREIRCRIERSLARTASQLRNSR